MGLDTSNVALFLNDDSAEEQRSRYLNSGQTCKMLGGITTMTLWRWSNDPVANFPEPIKVFGRNYWREAEVVNWFEAKAKHK